MSDDTGGNGSRYVTTRWLVGILLTVLIMALAADRNGVREDLNALKDHATQTAAWRAEQAMDRIRLERIEVKLDRLLEARP